MADPVAVAGVILGGSSLSWQVYANVTAGSRVRVRTTLGLVSADLQSPARMTIAVEARNVGRLATSIVEYGLITADNVWMHGMFWPVPETDPPRLPYTLEGQHQVQWHIPLDVVRQAVRAETKPPLVRGFVRLGTGKVRSSTPLDVS